MNLDINKIRYKRLKIVYTIGNITGKLSEHSLKRFTNTKSSTNVRNHDPNSVETILKKLEHAQQTHAQKASAQNSGQIGQKNEPRELGRVAQQIVIEVFVVNVERENIITDLFGRSILRERLV
jgi:hypothetical protein